MSRLEHSLLFASLLFAFSSSAVACDTSDGSRKQTAVLLVGQRQLVRWDATSSNIQEVALPNDFHLGVLIEDANAEKYRQLHEHSGFVPEMVHITLYDVARPAPHVLADTWGGANSLQTYGPEGGAARVTEVGQPGITLLLERPVCARS